MIRTVEGEWYSASDLLAWLGCHHRTTLDARVPDDPDLAAFLKQQRPAAVLLMPDGEDGDGFETPAQARGDLHERAMLRRLEDAGHQIVRIERPTDYSAAAIRERALETRAAMESGADVVFQATLLDAPWYGFADFLVRVDGVPSAFGDCAYEVRDTKLARHPSTNALLQMAHYGAILEKEQGAPPVSLVVWLGTGEEYPWAFDDAKPYLDELQSRYLAFRAAGAPTAPEPVSACGACRWEPLCSAALGADDLINVHRLTRIQRRRLREHGIITIESLAGSGEQDRPAGMAKQTFYRLRQQAAVQAGPAKFALIRPQPAEGLASIPAAHPADLYFDLEGDPFAAMPTLDYLWAYCDAQGQYACRWAHTPQEELRAFDWFLGVLHDREAAGGDWHVYHYNSYELTSLRRVAAAHPDPIKAAQRSKEVERLIEERFIDLYRAVELGLRTQAGSTSLKIVEKLAGYDRSAGAAEGAVARADDSIVAYETYTMSADEIERAAILDGIREYNAHDVRATKAVHHWLVELATQLAADDITPEREPYVTPDDVLERIERTEALRDALRAAAAPGEPLTSGLSAEGALLLAHMLEWHRAESVAQFVDLLRLKEWALAGGDLPTQDADGQGLWAALNGVEHDTHLRAPGTEHESVLLDVELVRVIGPKSSRKNAAITREYRCRPGSWKIRAGKKVTEALPEDADREPLSFEIEEIDPEEGTFVFSRGAVPADLGPLVLNDGVSDEKVWESLMRLGESALSKAPDECHRLGFALLDRTPPLPAPQMDVAEPTSGLERARALVSRMNAGLLPIQGPPGTGKTFVGAHLIADAVRRGGRDGGPVVIAITANSHKVINNLMVEAIERCAKEGVRAVFGHVGGKGKIAPHAAIAEVGGGDKPVGWIESQRNAGQAVVIGATKWTWSRESTAGIADLLIIDEAGQLTLADSCAVGQSAPLAIALGDPQQLSAPVKAAHDESVDVSLLDHIAQDAPVLPEEVGVFLDVSYRMHPNVCRVVADLAYNGALHSSEEATARDIHGPDVEVAGTTFPVAPGVVWIPVADDVDEVAVARAVLDQLVGRATVTLHDATTRTLDWDEVRIVAPHNAHVNRLDQALHDDAQVGTVDRFQGQQGDVVVFSMGRVADSPGDVPFLYELNRLNVALSRARLLAVVISHQDTVFPPVSSPEHLRLASRFIRVVSPTEVLTEA